MKYFNSPEFGGIKSLQNLCSLYIAFEFASWVSPQFKLYLIKEFERLKKEELAILLSFIKRSF